MRTKLMLAAGAILAILTLPGAATGAVPDSLASEAALETAFQATVRPFLANHCLECHSGKESEGDLDLASYKSAGMVSKDLARWELVVEQLELKAMPPAKANRRPPDDLRDAVIAWARSVREVEAAKNAGDPGPVPPRRLSNAEYDNTVRDLTGVDVRPTRDFPVDPANEEGFDNSAESLAMSPALVKKYLEAASLVAQHVVFLPQGLAFAPHPVVADTDRDKYSVRRVIDFYKRQRTDVADYFQAAWRFRHRDALRSGRASLDQEAAAAGISPAYLATVWGLLNDPAGERGPVAAVQSIWNALPSPDAPPAEVRKACEAMRDFVAELRRMLTPEVKNLTVRGMNNGAQPLVLWKNRQFVANRRRFVAEGLRLDPGQLSTGTEAARALAIPRGPEEVGQCEPSFAQFCAVFPDAFYVSERARVYLDSKSEKNNAGRLLSAGFHSMTGYFRDDAPLYELILDDEGRRELDRLWLEFDVVTGAPARQYASFLWFERTDSRFMRGAEFDFARAEDKDAASGPMIDRLAEVYLEKAKRNGASETAQQAIRDHFEIIAASLRRVEDARLAAEPSHVEALQDFAARAFRRPLGPEEREDVAGFYRRLRDQDGLGHEDAVRDTVARILMSPHFCYRLDLASDGEGRRELSDTALASRLSYFLWSSMPDDQLLAAASAGELHRPDALKAQARRMLGDDRVRALATEFGGNWLDFRRFEEHNSVDKARFPAFDDGLRRAMFEEPVRFFIDLVRNDRPVSEFIQARHTFVNPALARHYGIPEPSGGLDDWTRVDDADRYGRGGLLPMAVFLTKNAPGLRTSPVKRGYWVVRRLLGETIPAPPSNVPELPSDETKLGDATLRDALARHRADKSCAGCHERFDSIGLAFEGYGPVGESRDRDLGGRPIDSRVTYAGGVEGDGLPGLRAYLEKARLDEFQDNLCRKLLAYALGRSLLATDDATLKAMRDRLSSDGGRFGAIVEVIVTSPQFLNKTAGGREER